MTRSRFLRSVSHLRGRGGHAHDNRRFEAIIDWIVRSSADRDLTVYVAEVDGRAVGTASMMVMPNVTYGCAPSAFFEAVVVVADHRRLGIATAMLRRALDDAQGAGCNKVQLLSHKRHAADGAHRLYTSVGFAAEAEGFRLYLGPVPEAVAAGRLSRPG